MAPSSLGLFPSPSSSLPPRKSSLKYLQPKSGTNGAPDLSAVAIRVTEQKDRYPRIQPAPNTFKHALFCRPRSSAELSPRSPPATSPSSDAFNRGTPRRQGRTCRQSNQICNNSTIEAGFPVLLEEEEQERAPPTSPPTFSEVVQPDHANASIGSVDSRFSPLPGTTMHRHLSISDFDLKGTLPSRSDSPNLPRSTSIAKKPMSGMPQPQSPPSTRSIFPQYDHSKPMNQQEYYPTTHARPAVTSSASPPNMTVASPVDKPPPKRYDSAVGLVDGYEHIPAAEQSDLEELWKASCAVYPIVGRKVQFSLSTGHDPALAIGTSSGNIVYSLEKESLQYNSRGPKHISVQKHCPSAPSSSPVAQLTLRDAVATSDPTQDVTPIFPHQAAVDAIASVADSSEARAIATFDPMGESQQASMLARDAVSEAHRRYKCNLVRRTRKRDSLGSVIASYDLCHPSLGKCAITVTKSLSPTSISGPRAKISLHHPSATPAAVAADTLNLAFLDFARDACVLDIPGLLALDSHYVIDTVLSAFFAVAVLENNALVADTMTFAAPPKAAVNVKGTKTERRASTASSTKSKRMFKRTSSMKAQQTLEPVEEQVQLPVLTQSALTLIGVSFKTAVWLLGAGVKVTTGLVLSVDHLAKKL